MAIATLLDSQMPPFSQRASALAVWWQGPSGRYLAAEQAELLAQLDSRAGYHSLQLSSFGAQFQLAGHAECHSFALHPVALAGRPEHSDSAAALADFAELPLPSGVVDSILLHHALEYSRRPREVLAESCRVLSDGGQLTIVAFNPFSPWGAVAPWLGRLGRIGRYQFEPLARFHQLRAARLIDWLALLQLQVATVSYGAYNPPLPWPWAQRRGRNWQRWLAARQLPLGSCMVIHAVKRSVARLPPKPARWRNPLAAPGPRPQHAVQPSRQTERSDR